MFEQFKMASYNEAVVMGASLLAIKVGVLNVLTARSRFVHGDLATLKQFDSPENQEGERVLRRGPEKSACAFF